MYSNLHAFCLLSILELRTSEISNSGSLSTMTGGGGGGGGGWIQLGMVLGEACSNIETWKTGCTARMESGSHKVIE